MVKLREAEQLHNEGAPTSEIAAELGISIRTWKRWTSRAVFLSLRERPAPSSRTETAPIQKPIQNASASGAISPPEPRASKSLPRRLREIALGVFFAVAILFVTQGIAIATNGHLLVEGAVVVGSVLVVAAIVWLRFTESGRERARRNNSRDELGTFAVAFWLLALATTGFAALSGALYILHLGPAGTKGLKGENVGGVAYSYYVWHLLEAVPALKIPETLNWKLKHPLLDHTDGALAVAYQILVVAPLLYAAADAIRQWTAGAAPSDLHEDQDHVDE